VNTPINRHISAIKLRLTDQKYRLRFATQPSGWKNATSGSCKEGNKRGKIALTHGIYDQLCSLLGYF
ncbi:MAG: hypothetical protein AAF291_10415, partial [Pseudomonadota bacterium]